jgi:hypothetical protein
MCQVLLSWHLAYSFQQSWDVHIPMGTLAEKVEEICLTELGFPTEASNPQQETPHFTV